MTGVAVVLFVYRRPDLTRQVFAAVRAARPPRLYIVADGPRPGEKQRCVAAQAATEGVDWPCAVVREVSPENLGCKRRVSSGLDLVFAREERAIILEDDCLPCSEFFSFCEELLERYADEGRVASINGSAYVSGASPESDYRFSRYAHYGGWATWRRAWQAYDGALSAWPDRGEAWLAERFERSEVRAFWRERLERTHQGWLDSWGYAWTFACWLSDGLAVVPRVNLITNLGFREDAAHTTHGSPFAALPTGSLPLPLRHPAQIDPDRERDEQVQDLMLGELPGRPEAGTASPSSPSSPSSPAPPAPPGGGSVQQPAGEVVRRRRLVVLSARGDPLAGRLGLGLEAAGHEVVHLVHGGMSGPGLWRLPLTRRIEGALRRELERLRPDGILVQRLHGPRGWTPELLRVCHKVAPTVWWVDDMWSFSGRCLDSAGCRLFLSGCTADCPTPREYPALERRKIGSAWSERRRILEELPGLVALCPSRQLAREAQAGLWRGHRVESIPLPVPLDVFTPGDPERARAALGLALAGPVLLVLAESLAARRGGGPLLADALRRAGRPLDLLVLGRGMLPPLPAAVRVHGLGELDPHERALAFAAADAVVQPARREGFCLDLVDALACGTPIIATPSGGTRELIRPEGDGPAAGWIAERPRGPELGDALTRALEDLEAGVVLRDACLAASRKHDAVAVATRVAAVLEELIAARPGRTRAVTRLRRLLFLPRDRRADALRAAFQDELERSPSRAELVHYHGDVRSVDAVAADLAKGPEARRLAARARAAAGWRSVGAGQVLTARAAVGAAFGQDPSTWGGTLHVHAAGKSGEVFYVTGVLPSLREQLPAARLVLHVLPTYAPVAEGALHRFDAVERAAPPRLARLADRVAAQNYRTLWPGFAAVGRDLHVNAFRSHRWFDGDPLVSQGPLYAAFADALGCPREEYRRPGWAGRAPAPASRPVVLALPTANPHSSRRGGLPFTPAQWAELAEVARAKGLEPVAQGHADDGHPELPGWRWLNASLPGLFAQLGRARLVVGPNSGVIWAACLLADGPVVMLDDSSHSEDALGRYEMSAMGELLDLERCGQLRLPLDGRRDAEAFELTRSRLVGL